MLWKQLIGLTVLLGLLGGSGSAQTSRGIVRSDEAPSGAGPRTALVVGNSRYASAPLRNPVNDARAMAATLRRVGFDVELLLEASQKELKQAIDQFGQRLQPGSVGLFYYSGHGMQVEGRNYLIPVDAEIAAEADVEYESVEVGRVLAKMATAQNAMNLVILDACRNNPYARSFRSAAQGLAMLKAPSGTFIAYATAPGAVASDGAGRTGLFTGELIEQLETPGLKVEDVFKRVRRAVQQKSNHTQIPWEASSLTGDFYFRPAEASVHTSEQLPALHQRFQADQESWAMIKDSSNPEDFWLFLRSFPASPLAQAARLRLALLEQERQASLRAEPPVEIAPPFPVTASGQEVSRRAQSLKAYEQAVAEGSPLAIRKFIRQYETVPEAAFYVKRARSQLAEAQTSGASASASRREAAREAYEQVVRSGSALAYRSFIRQYAAQEDAQFYVKRAQARLQALTR